MSQEEMWPRDLPLSPTAVFGCILCGDIDHTSTDCPNILQVCKYCGGPLLVLTKMCSCCGLIHSEVPEYQVYQVVEAELCHLCRMRPVVINGMCELCNSLCTDVMLPPTNQFYEVGGPSNRLTPWPTIEDYNETRYDNNEWDPAPGEMIEIESVGSCEWLVIPSDNE